ncbi:MAG: N-acetylmuramoyl-L-alanine amidase family protein [Bacillaceae bacterium]
MKIRQNLVSPSKYENLCPYSLYPQYLTIHNTDNDASADNEVKNVINNSKQTGFHLAIDDKEAVQSIPFNRNAWHAGDGNGPGNRKSIGIEICYSLSGGSHFYKAIDNAVEIVADLAKQFNIPIENIVQHNKWSGKNCPSRMRKEGLWNKFIKDVADAMKPQSAIAGKRVESKVNGLNFYDGPRWTNPSGTFDKGYGFIIIDKVKVDGYDQYKVKNSKGAIYYVTASSKYVIVKDANK